MTTLLRRRARAPARPCNGRVPGAWRGNAEPAPALSGMLWELLHVAGRMPAPIALAGAWLLLRLLQARMARSRTARVAGRGDYRDVGGVVLLGPHEILSAGLSTDFAF